MHPNGLAVRRGKFNNLSDVEYLTADYVAYNQQRLMHRLGRVPPTEAEARFCSQRVTDRPGGSQTPRVLCPARIPVGGLSSVLDVFHRWYEQDFVCFA